jgi:hypothetical protein
VLAPKASSRGFHYNLLAFPTTPRDLEINAADYVENRVGLELYDQAEAPAPRKDVIFERRFVGVIVRERAERIKRCPRPDGVMEPERDHLIQIVAVAGIVEVPGVPIPQVGAELPRKLDVITQGKAHLVTLLGKRIRNADRS